MSCPPSRVLASHLDYREQSGRNQRDIRHNLLLEGQLDHPNDGELYPAGDLHSRHQPLPAGQRIWECQSGSEL